MSNRLSYVTTDGDDELIDMTAATSGNYEQDPVWHAMLRMMSRPGTRLEDFGFRQGDPTSTTCRVHLTINGRAVSFVDFVQSFYKDWETFVEEAAQKKIDDLLDGRMRVVEDDIDMIRQHMREQFSSAFAVKKIQEYGVCADDDLDD